MIADSGYSASCVAGVSFSAHGKGLYAIDRAGQPVRNVIISADTRALTQVLRWQEQGITEQSYPLGWQQLWCGHPATLLRWLKDHEPANYDRIDSVLMAHDYLRFCLTGEIAAEVTNISGSNLYNSQKQAYEPQLMQLFGIEEVREKTAPVIGSSTLAGKITPQAAQQCGLPAGTAVYGGLFDVVAAAVCSAATDERVLSAVAGTWSIATCILPEIIAADYPYIWGDYCLPGQYFVHEGSPTSSSNLAWFVRHFCQEQEACYQQFDQWVANRSSQLSQVVFLPYLYGSNLSANLNGSLVGLRGHHGTEDVVHAIYQGILFSHLLHQDRLLQLNQRVECIRISGGPTQSAAWMQMFADGSNLPLEVIESQQSGCRAAALCAAVGAGEYYDFAEAMEATLPATRLFEPRPQQHDELRQQMARYLQVAQALGEVG
ncbi:MAG: FGGY-family carbohydrate kinase [Enterobacteriaceae bacterium]